MSTTRSQLSDALAYVAEYGFGDNVSVDAVIEQAAAAHLEALAEQDEQDDGAVPAEAQRVHPQAQEVLEELAEDAAAATMAVLWLAEHSSNGEVGCNHTHTGDPTVSERPRYVEVQFNLEQIEGHLARPVEEEPGR